MTLKVDLKEKDPNKVPLNRKHTFSKYFRYSRHELSCRLRPRKSLLYVMVPVGVAAIRRPPRTILLEN